MKTRTTPTPSIRQKAKQELKPKTITGYKSAAQNFGNFHPPETKTGDEGAM